MVPHVSTNQGPEDAQEKRKLIVSVLDRLLEDTENLEQCHVVKRLHRMFSDGEDQDVLCLKGQEAQETLDLIYKVTYTCRPVVYSCV